MSEHSNSARTLFAISGEDAVHFLQGILTQDVTKLAVEKIQFAALLSPQGKILHDLFLVAQGDRILIDTPTLHAPLLKKRLMMYKLRAKVTISEVTDIHVTYSHTAGLADPRHPLLPRRAYISVIPAQAGISVDASASLESDSRLHRNDAFISEAEYRTASVGLGIPDSAIDFAPDEVVALDAGYDLLHAVSFTKGCYVGQEVTARMHYKNIARRGFYILQSDLAPRCLALLKFEDVEKSGGRITHGGIDYHAQLPEWMQPKFAQFQAEKLPTSH